MVDVIVPPSNLELRKIQNLLLCDAPPIHVIALIHLILSSGKINANI